MARPMPPDAPVIKAAGLVFDRLGLLVAVRVFEAERVMEVWIMRGQAREGKDIAYLANKDTRYRNALSVLRFTLHEIRFMGNVFSSAAGTYR